MSAGIRAIREGIATAIGGTITAYDTLPGAPIPPFAVVMYPDLIDLDRTMGGLHEYELTVDVYVSLADVKTGQEALDDIIDGGMKAALEAYAGPWRNIRIDSVRNIRPEALDNVSCLAASFYLVVIG